MDPCEAADLPDLDPIPVDRADRPVGAADLPDLPVARSVWSPEQVETTGDAEVARVASRQGWFVHRKQLHAAGLGRHRIAHRVRTRQLRTYHPAVFLVGGRAELLGPEWAAVLHFEGHGVLSHHTAARTWGLVERPAGGVEVTVVGRESHSRPGLRVHRALELPREELRRRFWLPVTSPARTVVDVNGGLTELEVEHALYVVREGRLCAKREILAALDRTPKRARAGLLRRLLADGHAGETRSKWERRLLALVRQSDLPRPRTNAWILGMKVDLAWPEQKLVVEFDGWDFHNDRASFESDRLRDQRLAAAGYLVIRVTARQLEQEPYAVIARIAAALALRAAA